MKVQTKVQTKYKSNHLYFAIYSMIKEGIYPSLIAKKLNLKKSNVNYYVKFLKDQGIIARRGKVIWETLKNLSEQQLNDLIVQIQSTNDLSMGLREKPSTNLHALQINFPILQGKIQDNEWEIKNKLKNWLPKYKGLEILGGLTLRNNNNKSLTVFVKSRNIQSLEEIDDLALKVRGYICEYFKNKHGVILDFYGAETKNLNIATEDPQSEGMLKKGESFELDLNKQAEKIFKPDSIKGKAWLDGSPYKFSAETNDKDWKRAYLQMPFAIREIQGFTGAIAEYTQQIKLHLAVEKEQLKTQKETQQTLKELRDFFTTS